MNPLSQGLLVTFDHFTNYAAQPFRRPIISIELAGVTPNGILKGTDTTTVLVDSGADTTLLNSVIAPRLGLDLASMPTEVMGGVGGRIVVHKATVLARLCSVWVELPVAFDPNRDINLLGRDGAFDALRLAFVHGSSVLLAAKR